jgi:hypothetical protein
LPSLAIICGVDVVDVVDVDVGDVKCVVDDVLAAGFGGALGADAGEECDGVDGVVLV